MTVTETFFALGVKDMDRATTFYKEVFGATVSFASPGWSSLHVAGVRIGLYPDPNLVGGRVGLHFVVDDLPATEAATEAAGGRLDAAVEVAPGVVVRDVTDPEGNVLSVRRD